MVNDFTFTRTPEIYFGQGRIGLLPGLCERFGNNILVISGARSFPESEHYEFFKDGLKKRSLKHFLVKISREPSPQLVDGIINEYLLREVDLVVAIGGGSVLDTGKAVAAMMHQDGFVQEFMEGIGTGRQHPGRKTPFIAVPTTAGTGSETTKNAVLSIVGKDGFKKSLRHESFVPDIALVDPALTTSCPAEITAACGMDAFTQLLESYVSVNASPMTDALCLSGLEHLKRGLPGTIKEPGDLSARSSLSYAAMVSGMALANAGLGVVHGFASRLGGYFDIPHGVICGTLAGSATRANILKLKGEGDPARTLQKYARVGKILSGKDLGQEELCQELVLTLEAWTDELKIPRLGQYGIQLADVNDLADKTDQKYNPISLSIEEMRGILKERI